MYLKKLAIALAFPLLLLGNSGSAISSGTSATDCPLESLAAEFKQLRQIPGHFGGSSWNSNVDKWDGRKHQVMAQLGSCLGNGKYSPEAIAQLMGKPDAIAVKGDYYYAAIVSDRPRHRALIDTDKFLVYYWRGGHDFLYFAIKGESAVKYGWWFAGE